MNNIIQIFIEFLNGSLPSFNQAEGHIEDEVFFMELRNDFFQANWEILVESLLCVPGKEYLEVYGDGADCNGYSSRVCFPDKLPTHRVKVSAKNDSEVINQITGNKVNLENHIFHSFVHFENGKWTYTSPVNSVLLESETGFTVVKVGGLIFNKLRIKEMSA